MDEVRTPACLCGAGVDVVGGGGVDVVVVELLPGMMVGLGRLLIVVVTVVVEVESAVDEAASGKPCCGLGSGQGAARTLLISSVDV
jgi:hypothetical protein